MWFRDTRSLGNLVQKLFGVADINSESADQGFRFDLFGGVGGVGLAAVG